MSTQRYLVLGDNHGDTESLARVVDDTAGERFDYAIHVGDFTKAMRDGRDVGSEQLRAVEPYLEDIDARSRNGLCWVYGNQDRYGDLDADLSVGVRIPDDDLISVGGQRFTAAPALVDDDVILVTHLERWDLVDHFHGRAHFCGNSHLGRHLGRRLNSAFLHVDDPAVDEGVYGGYFEVELDPQRPAASDGVPGTNAETDAGPVVDVTHHSVGRLERVTCDVHGERGVQYLPAYRDCMYCSDPVLLHRELASSAFHGVTDGLERDAATVERVVEYATDLLASPPPDFASRLEDYLTDLEADEYAPLASTDDGQLRPSEYYPATG